MTKLYMIHAKGFGATADAFVRDPDENHLYFLSMVGPQTALKAIWAAMLNQPPEPGHLLAYDNDAALAEGYLRCDIPPHTLGTWTTRITKLPASGGYHAMIYTKKAEYQDVDEKFLLLAQDQSQAPKLHHRFLNKRLPIPLHHSWADWLWLRGNLAKEIKPLQSHGIHGYWCTPDVEAMREAISLAIATGQLEAKEDTHEISSPG